MPAYRDLILKAKKAVKKATNKNPYALFCNMKTFRLMQREFEIANPILGLLVEIDENAPDDTIHIVSKNMYERLMEEKEGYHANNKHNQG